MKLVAQPAQELDHREPSVNGQPARLLHVGQWVVGIAEVVAADIEVTCDPARSGIHVDTPVDWRAKTDGDDGDWLSAVPDDGLLSATRELFTIRAEDLDAEVTALEVRLRDAAGNVTVEEIPIVGAVATGDEADVAEDAQG